MCSASLRPFYRHIYILPSYPKHDEDPENDYIRPEKPQDSSLNAELQRMGAPYALDERE